MTARDRILVTHVGSLPRPAPASRIHRSGSRRTRRRRRRVRVVPRRGGRRAVRLQVEAGVDIASDGEFGKFRTRSGYVIDRLGGLEEREAELPVGTGKDQSRFPEFYAEYFPTQRILKRRIVACVGPLSYVGQDRIGRDIRDLKAAVEGLDVAGAFLPLVAPASATPQFVDEHYVSERDYQFGLAEALEVYREWAELRIDAVGHATNVVEHPELVAERLLRLSDVVGRGNLMAGTDCGCAPSPFTNRVHPSVVWAKLRALSEGAEIASRQLWPGGGG